MDIEDNGAVETATEDAAAALESEISGNPAPPQGEEASGDDAAAAPEPAPKPKATVQDRIDELTRARREAERDRDFYREQALRAQQPQQAQPQQATEPESDEPNPEHYTHGENDLGYIRDLARYEAREEFRREAAHAEARQTVQAKLRTFEDRATNLFPDGEPQGLTAFRQIPQLPVAVLEIVSDSDVGPKIADHLGANPAELQRLAKMTPVMQARELTLLETRLTAPTPEPKAPAKTATDAPEPPPQARGAGGQFKVSADTSDFAAFEKTYGN